MINIVIVVVFSTVFVFERFSVFKFLKKSAEYSTNGFVAVRLAYDNIVPHEITITTRQITCLYINALASARRTASWVQVRWY